MKRLKRICAVGLLAGAVLFADTWTGVVTDAKCANTATPTGEEHKKHVDDGQPVVFINDGDHKIFQIENPEQVKSMVGHRVKLVGKVAASKSGSISIETASEAH